MSYWILGITLGCLSLLTMLQFGYVFAYLRFLRREKVGRGKISEPLWAEHDQPKVAVILCLRGADPSLVVCLRNLLALDYDNYELHLVFDDPDDPAVEVCRRQVDERSDVHFHMSLERGVDRSLKCSSLISTILELPSDIEVVALVDADAIAQSDWLRQLVAPLRDPQVGASTGNRWFAPEGSSLGTTLRKLWNAAALPQMCHYQIAWGGSLAIRRQTVEACELLDRWSVSFCEDTLLSRQLAEYGMRVKRVPGLIVVNRESTAIAHALVWIRRQLLTVRLYHASWNLVLGHALFGAICLFGPPLAGLYFLIRFQWWELVMIAGFWSAYQLLNFGLMLMIELGNRRAIESRLAKLNPTDGPQANARRDGAPRAATGEDSDLGPLVATPSGLIAYGVLQLLYPFLAIGAAFQHKVSWRGIDYRIHAKSRIEMVEYLPFQNAMEAEKTGSDHSIQ